MCADACLRSVSIPAGVDVCFSLVDSLCTGRSLRVARLFIMHVVESIAGPRLQSSIM